jgi:hypothetical protein
MCGWVTGISVARVALMAREDMLRDTITFEIGNIFARNSDGRILDCSGKTSRNNREQMTGDQR